MRYIEYVRKNSYFSSTVDRNLMRVSVPDSNFVRDVIDLPTPSEIYTDMGLSVSQSHEWGGDETSSPNTLEHIEIFVDMDSPVSVVEVRPERNLSPPQIKRQGEHSPMQLMFCNKTLKRTLPPKRRILPR